MQDQPFRGRNPLADVPAFPDLTAQRAVQHDGPRGLAISQAWHAPSRTFSNLSPTAAQIDDPMLQEMANADYALGAQEHYAALLGMRDKGLSPVAA